jgi:hypothetical protein
MCAINGQHILEQPSEYSPKLKKRRDDLATYRDDLAMCRDDLTPCRDDRAPMVKAPWSNVEVIIPAAETSGRSAEGTGRRGRREPVR